MRWTSNPYLIPPMTGQSVTQYLVFHGQLALNYTLSRVRCEAVGGDLADVDNMEVFRYLHERLHQPAYIASFDGKTFSSESALALYPGGAVAIPEGTGGERMSSICEVPLLGTFGIDLSRYGQAADRSVPIGAMVPANASASHPDPDVQELLRRGLVLGGGGASRDGRFAGLSRQSGPIGARAGVVAEAGAEQGQFTSTATGPTTTQSVTTVVIYGSIETDPALPCCRCCNPI